MENLEVRHSNRFEFHSTPLERLWVVQRKPVDDSRGFFCRFFCAEEFQEVGFKKPVAQINHALTVKKGTVRGLHFQYPPYSEMKIISCLRGEIYDVAVDIRKDSPTFLHWYGENLSAVNQKSLLIPEGFAHGFQTLTENCELLYLHSETFHPLEEGALNVTDPGIGVLWPITITELSERDQGHPFVNPDFKGISQ